MDWDPEELERLAHEGHAEAQGQLGAAFYYGEGDDEIGQDLVSAAYWLRAAAEQRDPYACLLLADMFWSGEGGLPQNQRISYQCILVAEELGFERAKSQLAIRLLLSQGCERNDERAEILLREASELGIEDAQYYLGSMIEKRFIAGRFDTEGLYWIERAVQNGADVELHSWLADEIAARREQ